VTNFADLAGIARTTLAAIHGEVARLKPRDRLAGPHGASIPSTDRAEADVVACFWRDTEFEARRRAQPLVGQTGQRMASRSAEIFASTGHAGPFAVGDHLARPVTGELFEIVSRDPDGIGNTILGLAAIKGD
jgi:hypothetical protein